MWQKVSCAMGGVLGNLANNTLQTSQQAVYLQGAAVEGVVAIYLQPYQ